jgi:uncharacterized protein YndB with AHSA1/START domain
MNDAKPTRDIELTIELSTPPDVVWHAITTGDEIAKWFAPIARVTPGVGGRIFVSWGEGMGGEAPIEVFDAPRRLRYSYGENGETKAALWIDWHLEGHGGLPASPAASGEPATPARGTTLRLVHSGFSAGADWDEEYDAHARGWRIFLTNLRHYLARHRGAAIGQHLFVATHAKSREAIWPAVLGALIGDASAASAKVGGAVSGTSSRGDAIRGKIDVMVPARDVGVVLEDLDDALLRVSLERTAGGGTMLFGVVLAPEANRERAAALAKSLGAIAEALSPS